MTDTDDTDEVTTTRRNALLAGGALLPLQFSWFWEDDEATEDIVDLLIRNNGEVVVESIAELNLGSGIGVEYLNPDDSQNGPFIELSSSSGSGDVSPGFEDTDGDGDAELQDNAADLGNNPLKGVGSLNGNGVVTDGDGTTREIYVIANGASDPADAGAEDIIFEEQ